ncbi:MAG TPA: hypothetical protein VMP89_17925 [Solirubrobacteraceae bacterium]|nr:hypothetical protein [Solirubrobacteraceae bacterium]
MSLPQRTCAAVAAVAALVCAFAAIAFALPSPARASSTEVSMLLDDDQLIYSSPQHMVQTLQTLHALGVDVVKVSMVWQLVAPDSSSTQRPANFDATNPADYPPGAWARWDTLVETAQSLGMKVYFLVIGPAPTWAVAPQNRTSQGPYLGWMPNATEYEQFVQAVGTRYSGTYVDPTEAAQTASASTVAGVSVPSVGATAAQATQPIPRVSYWGIWNEPNERSWLDPWYKTLPHHRKELLQPSEYRTLVGAAWDGLSASGHTADTIMVGETANRGIWSPEPFVRALYCVGSNLRPLHGTAASLVGCPTSGSRSQFVSQNPGLFQTSYAHHPYGFEAAPNRPDPVKGFVTLYNIPSFERMLNGIHSSYGQRSPGGVPLYLTEWGFKTNPPNPTVRTTPAQQAAYINEGEYMTWQEPYVHGLTQFLLVDSPPKPGTRKGSALYWSTFQTGLEYINGTQKPSFAAFQVPIWLPNPRHGRHVTVWGELRPADHTTTQYGEIEFQRKGSRTWRELTEVQTNSTEGFVVAHVSIPSAGQVRLDYLDPGGPVPRSRSVAVS